MRLERYESGAAAIAGKIGTCETESRTECKECRKSNKNGDLSVGIQLPTGYWAVLQQLEQEHV